MARHVGTLTGDVELTQHSVDKAEAILAELLRDRVIKLNVNVAAGQAEKAGKQAEKDAERAAGDIELGVTLKPGEAAAAGKTAEKEAEAAAGEVELKPKVDKTKAAAEGAAASKVAETAAPPVKIKTKVDKKDAAAEGAAAAAAAQAAAAAHPVKIPASVDNATLEKSLKQSEAYTSSLKKQQSALAAIKRAEEQIATLRSQKAPTGKTERQEHRDLISSEQFRLGSAKSDLARAEESITALQRRVTELHREHGSSGPLNIAKLLDLDTQRKQLEQSVFQFGKLVKHAEREHRHHKELLEGSIEFLDEDTAAAYRDAMGTDRAPKFKLGSDEDHYDAIERQLRAAAKKPFDEDRMPDIMQTLLDRQDDVEQATKRVGKDTPEALRADLAEAERKLAVVKAERDRIASQTVAAHRATEATIPPPSVRTDEERAAARLRTAARLAAEERVFEERARERRAGSKTTPNREQSAAMRAFREADRAVNEFEASNPNWQDTKKGEREWNRLADRFGAAHDKLSPAEAREISGIKKGQILTAEEEAVAQVKQHTEAVKEHTEAVKKDVAAEKQVSEIRSRRRLSDILSPEERTFLKEHFGDAGTARVVKYTGRAADPERRIAIHARKMQDAGSLSDADFDWRGFARRIYEFEQNRNATPTGDAAHSTEKLADAVREVQRTNDATKPTGDHDVDVKRTADAVKQGVVEAQVELDRREASHRNNLREDVSWAVGPRGRRVEGDQDVNHRLWRAPLALEMGPQGRAEVAARNAERDAAREAVTFIRAMGLREANRHGGTSGSGADFTREGLSRNLPDIYRGRHAQQDFGSRVNHDFYRAPALAIGMGPEHLRGRGPMDSAARAAADARAEALRNWHNTMASTSGDGGSRLGRAISEFRQLRAEARGAAGALKEAERNYHSLREKAMDASDAVRRSSIALHQQRFTLRQGGMSEAAVREHLAPQRLAHEGLVLERETAWRAASTAHRDLRTMRRDLGGSNNGSGGFRGFAKNAVSGLGDALDQVGYHALRFLGISSLVIAALSVIGPLASVAAAGVVGLGAALTVGGVGAASGLLGLSGIIPKVQQLSQARSEQRDPWKVADANHQETTALHALTQARWQESDASTNQLLAQRTLDQSVKDATRNLEDMTRAQEAQRLALEGSSLSAVRARIEMVKAQIQYRHGQITNLDLAEATNRYHVAMNAWEQAKVDKKRFNEDQAIERKRGVRGSTEVIQAQQGMIQANRAVKQAAWASRDAAFQLRKLRHELGYLLGPQEKKSWIDHLFLHTGPKTRELVEMIDRKGAPAFLRLRKASAEALAPGLEEGLKTLVGYEGPITDTFTKFNTVIGDNFAGMMKQFGTNPVWVTFFHNLSKDGPKALNDMLDALGNFGTGFAGVMNGMRPTLKHMMSSIGDMGKSFAHWSKGKEAKDFFKYIRTEGPKIAHDLRDIGGGVKAFFIKLAPFGKGVLDNLAAVGRWLERIDGDKLTQLAKIITLSTGAVFGAKILKGTMGIFGSMGRILGVSPTNPMYVRVVGAWGASGGTPGTGGGTGGSRSGSTAVVGAGGESRQSVRERWRNRGEGGYMALPGGGTGTRTSGGPRVGLRERYGRSGGAAGGIGLAALIGGQMIGGKSGDFVSLVGTGAMLGSMAGPWGAAAGAAIMAAINAPSIGKQIGSSLGNWWNHRNDSNDRAKVAVESINRAGSLDHITLQMETGQLSLEEGRKQLAGIVNKVIGEHHSNGEMGQMTEYNKSLRNANKELQHLQTQQDRTARKARRAFTAFENEMKASGRWAGYIARTRRQVEIMAAETTSAINSTVNSILPWNFAGFKVPNINVNGKTLADSIYTPATHTKHHHYNPYQDLLHGKGSSGRNNLGGVIPGSAYGGTVYGAGTSKSDSVLTRLSVGEEVIQEPYATRNRALLKALNRGMVPVAAGSTAATVPVSSPATVQVEINATSESKLARAIGFEVGIQTKLAQRGGGDWE